VPGSAVGGLPPCCLGRAPNGCTSDPEHLEPAAAGSVYCSHGACASGGRAPVTRRAIRAGTPLRTRRAAGHADVAMVAKVYGRFAPRSDERDRWERIAAAQDQNLSEMGAPSEAPNNENARKPLAPRALSNSRGGTRTLDPGIMRAVPRPEDGQTDPESEA